ncbi:haloacid dehalogenase-like hydrolase [Bifidobacterium eulemuris]|uniref:HAD family hydrolase n=2 Tax=Bifidobacterium eulemuris TaxID=1765219 RepID=A0A261G2M7_9BIFI|nr:haloacid dehalogenase-like hydrolase [Bifidobacterium eulemuris]QOL32406.1 HAD family hydrolase [Bifidobacterium eulemuris]
MTMDRRYDVACFDLYGTLVDIRTDEYDKKAWEKFRGFLNDSGMGVHYDDQWFLRDLLDQALILEQRRAAERVREAGVEDCPDECVEPNRGEGYRSLFAVAAPQGRIPAVWQAQADEMALRAAWVFRKASTRHIGLYPGALEMLRNLRGAGMRTVLVTNAQSCYTVPELEMLGLDVLFDAIVISSEEGIKKPHPEIFRRALERVGATPDRAVMIGNDERCDIIGAKNAGIDGVYINSGISPEHDPQRSEEAVLSLDHPDYDALLAFLLG